MTQELIPVNNVPSPVNPGQPTKLSPELVKHLEECFQKGFSITEACYAVGISRTTYYNYLKDDKELVDKFEWAQNAPLIRARETIYESLNDPMYAWKYAEKKLKAEFGDKPADVTNNNNLGTVVNVTLDPSKVKPSVLERILKERQNGNN